MPPAERRRLCALASGAYSAFTPAPRAPQEGAAREVQESDGKAALAKGKDRAGLEEGTEASHQPSPQTAVRMCSFLCCCHTKTFIIFQIIVFLL